MRPGGALEPLAEIHASDLPHVEETSWKEHAQLLWPWVLTSATTTVRTLGRRTQARLRGLTHPVGKARGLEDSLDPQARDFGNALRHCLKTVMAAVYAAREGPPPMALRALHAQQLNALFDLCPRHAEARHQKTRALARERLNDWDTFWVVLDHPDLPLTNHSAERALRHGVIAQPISYSTPNPQGSRAFRLLASIIETRRQRGHSPWPYLAETVRERRRGNPAPLLPAAVA